MSEEKNAFSRRDLLRTVSASVATGALTLGMGNSEAEAQEKLAVAKPKTEDRNSVKTLPRRRLGRTNMMVTVIGTGGSGITDATILNRAIDKGINYIDTAPAYGDSETVHGEVMKDRRKDVFLATKWWPQGDWSIERCMESLEKSLKALKTDHVDLLQLHSVDTEEGKRESMQDGYRRIDNPNLHKAMELAKKQGKARYFGVSSHNPHRKDLLKHAIDTGHFDTILVAFNSMNYEPSGMPELLEYAKKHDIGVIGMKAGSGSVKVPNAKPLTAQLAWVLSKDIHTIINSHTTKNDDSQDECLAAAKLTIGQKERDLIERYAAATHNEYCRGCSHICETACPESVKIGDILRFEMYHKHYGENHHEFAKQSYLKLAANERVLSVCGNCRKCEEACLYDLPIVDKLHYVDRELA